jgi:hypothetical protein
LINVALRQRIYWLGDRKPPLVDAYYGSIRSRYDAIGFLFLLPINWIIDINQAGRRNSNIAASLLTVRPNSDLGRPYSLVGRNGGTAVRGRFSDDQSMSFSGGGSGVFYTPGRGQGGAAELNTKMKHHALVFSVAKNGYRTAYRWSGDNEFRPGNFVHVPAVDGERVDQLIYFVPPVCPKSS